MSLWRSGRRTCAALAEMRSAYVDQALDAPDRERLVRHLAQCRFCRSEVADLRRLRRLLGGSPPAAESPPTPLAGRLLAIAGGEASQPLWSRPFDRGPVGRLPRRRQQVRWSTGAGVLLVAVAAVGVGLAAAPPPVPVLTDHSKQARTEFAAVAAQLPLTSGPVAAVMLAADTLDGSHPESWPGVSRPTSSDRGLRTADGPLDVQEAVAELLRTAAASGSVSFTGEQTFIARVEDRMLRATVETRSRAGRGSVVQVFDTAGRETAATYLPAGLITRLPDATQVALLAENYSLTGWEGATVAGRSATVVQADRLPSAASSPAGRPAARWWVDHETGLLLWFEMYGAAGQVEMAAGFTEIAVSEPRAAEHLPPRVVVPMTTTSLTLSATAGLQSRGWACPDHVAGLHLVRLRSDADDNPSVVHLAYSDGLSAVSVFEQRGDLRDGPSGQWDDRVGAFILPGAPRLASWQSGDRVFTVVTDGPDQLLNTVVRALPHQQAPPRTTMERVQAGWARILALVTG